MENDILQGPLELTESGNGVSISIKKVYPVTPDGETPTIDMVMEHLQRLNVVYGIDEEAIRFALDLAQIIGKPVEAPLVAYAKLPTSKDGNDIELTVPSQAKPDQFTRWNMMALLLKYFEPETKYLFPCKLVLVHEGQTIARRKPFDRDRIGVNIFSEELAPGKANPPDWKAGDNVTFDEKQNVFIAGACGYLILQDGLLSVKPPFHISKDKMKLIFMNLPRVNNELPNERDITNYFQKNKIPLNSLIPLKQSGMADYEHPVMAKGKRPGESVDAEVKFLVLEEKLVGKVDDSGKIDYRERDTFTNIPVDTLLATKKLPKRGESGLDIFLSVVNPKPPKDIILNYGAGTRVEKDDNEMRIYAADDGVLDYRNSIISIIPSITVAGDVNYETGNINTTANVQVMGSVLTGFRVVSAKNIIIKGSVEDNCHIEAKGDISISGGISGESTKIICGGNFVAKFVETCHLVSTGTVTIQRFIRGAKVECGDSCIIFGVGINLNERGALVDGDISVRKALICPAVGSDAGLKNTIRFGYDHALYQKIEQLQEACQKMAEQIKEMKGAFDLDGPSVKYKGWVPDKKKSRKEQLEELKVEIQSLEKKYNMMAKILETETQKRNLLLGDAYVEINKKIFPDLILQCNDMQKTIDTLEGPSKFYFDTKTRMIERNPFVKRSE